MIQRIQSIFLFLAAIVSGVLSIFLDLWKKGNEWMQAEDYSIIFALFLSSSVLSMIVIFLFKNRKRQMIYTKINLVLNIVLVGLLIYRMLHLPGEFASEKGIGLFLPFITMFLLWLANRNIQKDEKLVKSADRFR